MRGKGFKRTRTRGLGDEPPKKKQMVDVDEEYDIVEKKASAYQVLLQSLPSVKRTEKKEIETPKITPEEEEIQEEAKIPVPKWQGPKEIVEIDLEEFSANEESSDDQPKEEKSEEDSSLEDFEEEAENEEEQIGTDHADHFNIALTTDQIQLLSKDKQQKYVKNRLLSVINESMKDTTSSAMYSPLCPEFDQSESDVLQVLPTEHVDAYKKIKKDVYIESIKEVCMRKKVRDAFGALIGKYIKGISKHRKRLLSIHEGTFPMETQKQLFHTFCLLFPLFDQYYDVFYSLQTLFNAEITRMAYMLHVVNHTSKMRSVVTKNSQKIHFLQKKEKEIKKDMKFVEREYYSTHKKQGKKVPLALQSKLEEFEAKLYEINEQQASLTENIQDQGFTRPRTLIFVPTQEIGGALVELIMGLYPVSQIHHRKRFYEYFLPRDRDVEPHQFKRPDYNAMFHGNTNDTFYICIKVAQRMLKLYADPYDSDIIIASPIGLRGMIDKKEERRGRHDFLSSIEICILDLSDVFLMQNWSHLEFIFKHMNELPELSRDTDFSRVKPYFLEGWAKYKRQTIILSEFITPEIQALFNRQCFNYKGKIRFQQTFKGVISTTITGVAQKFEKIFCKSLSELNDVRYNYFIGETLAQIRAMKEQNHTLIFIPSYFDYVRIRNYMKQERFSFVSITEYTDNSEIARSRLAFLKGETDILLVTERFYFFRRYKVRGIKNLVFYAPPLYPSFYEDFVNSLEEFDGSSTLLYVQPFDQLSVQRIAGTKRCRKMISSPKNSHLLLGGK